MKKFIILLIVTFAIGVVPSLFIDMDVSNLTLPALYPPKIAFPIVWTILFILMTISIYRVTNRSDEEPYKIYFIQLIVNTFWTIIFFGLKLRTLAFIWLIILFVLVIKMILEFKKHDKISAYLQVPYVIWLIIAGYLNLAILLLN